uniref:CHASE2 domain-containing protein n=1 Tax=Parerythrobacter lutipelagi TaxID=1964208 RepID=UPI0010F861D4|nr:adenylate/guanylate cyclase domain-containing protein [Parerythrobacter lutipelagi]
MFERLRNSANGLAIAVGLAAMLAVALLQWADLRLLRLPGLQVFDLYQQAAPREYRDPSVRVVDIDEDSIERVGQWPWPRTQIARLTERLSEAGAAVIAFDVVFSEPDRTSPEAIAAGLRRSDPDSETAARLDGLPGNDAALAESFAKTNVVSGYFLYKSERGGEYEPPVGVTIAGSDPEKVERYEGVIAPLPVLDAEAQGAGFLTKEKDYDGVTRRAPLVAMYDGQAVTALSVEALRVAQGAGTTVITMSDASSEGGGAPGSVVSLRIGDFEVPTTEAGEIWVWFSEEQPDRTIPAWKVLDEGTSIEELADAVQGRIVFVGTGATGLRDIVATPLNDEEAGVMVHAQAAEQMIEQQFLVRPDWAWGLERILVIILGAALALLLPRLGAVVGAAVGSAGILGVGGGSWLAFSQEGLLIDPTYPVLGLVAVYGLQTVFAFNREEHRRAYIHQAFDRYLSPALVRQIAEDPGKLELGGEEREMTVLFCDIRSFSAISEQMDPKAVIDFLVAFLTPMCDELLERKATVDKFMGDAILAFWNAPLDDPEHFRNGARSALAMIDRLKTLNEQMAKAKKDVPWPGEVKIGIGMNSGLCCVGNMGSSQRLSYSLIGDTVNLASRLEGLSKTYGVPIVIGSDLAANLDGFALLELDRVRVVGRDAPETIFGLLGDEELASREELGRLSDAHNAMLTAYRAQQWSGAQHLLDDDAEAYRNFGLAALLQLYRDRCTGLAAAPPGEDWDGVYQATSK